jgi:hypothetical protein
VIRIVSPIQHSLIVFLLEVYCVLCEVRTEVLYMIQVSVSLQIVE